MNPHKRKQALAKVHFCPVCKIRALSDKRYSLCNHCEMQRRWDKGDYDYRAEPEVKPNKPLKQPPWDKTMIYLASPYSHPDPAIMQNRYELARNYTFKEIRKGLPMFSPIVHCHDMYLNCKGAESNFNYWREYNIQMLRLSTELHILTLPGWRDSQGVAFELYAAEERSIPTVYVNG